MLLGSAGGVCHGPSWVIERPTPFSITFRSARGLPGGLPRPAPTLKVQWASKVEICFIWGLPRGLPYIHICDPKSVAPFKKFKMVCHGGLPGIQYRIWIQMGAGVCQGVCRPLYTLSAPKKKCVADPPTQGLPRGMPCRHAQYLGHVPQKNYVTPFVSQMDRVLAHGHIYIYIYI